MANKLSSEERIKLLTNNILINKMTLNNSILNEEQISQIKLKIKEDMTAIKKIKKYIYDKAYQKLYYHNNETYHQYKLKKSREQVIAKKNALITA